MCSPLRRGCARDQKSFLYRLCHADPLLDSDRKAADAYLINKDPTYVGPVLISLSLGKLVNKDLAMEGVLEKADLYNAS